MKGQHHFDGAVAQHEILDAKAMVCNTEAEDLQDEVHRGGAGA